MLGDIPSEVAECALDRLRLAAIGLREMDLDAKRGEHADGIPGSVLEAVAVGHAARDFLAGEVAAVVEDGDVGNAERAEDVAEHQQDYVRRGRAREAPAEQLV